MIFSFEKENKRRKKNERKYREREQTIYVWTQKDCPLREGI